VTDEELKRAILSGDEQSFTELVRGLHPTLVRLARPIVGNDAVADEVVQETWVAVIHGLRQFEGRSSLKTWIISILVNRARTRAKRESRTVPLSSLDPEGDAEADPEAGRFSRRGFWSAPPVRWERQGPEGRLLDREAMERLAVELEKLPPSQRAVIILRDVEGLSSQEVCNLLEVTETNERVLLHRGRARLRAALERHFAG
jgi:RNA polymerase sigma-70 factor, ECF subfamily